MSSNPPESLPNHPFGSTADPSSAKRLDLERPERLATEQPLTSRLVGREGLVSPTSRMDNPTKSGQRCATRLCLSITAISLLWMTSLTSIVAFVDNGDIITTPSFSHVRLEVDAFVNETVRLRDSYQECVIRSLSLCNTTLQASIVRERERSSAARTHNLHLALEAEHLNEQCAAARDRARAAVAEWRRLSPIPTSPHSAQCPLSVRAQIEVTSPIIDEEIAAAHSVNAEYANRSQSMISQLVDQIVARAAYDREYIYNKTLANLRLRQWRHELVANFSIALHLRLSHLNVSELLACATLAPPRGSSCPTVTLQQLVNASQRRLYASWLGAYSTWGESVKAVDRYVDSAQALLLSLIHI